MAFRLLFIRLNPLLHYCKTKHPRNGEKLILKCILSMESGNGGIQGFLGRISSWGSFFTEFNAGKRRPDRENQGVKPGERNDLGLRSIPIHVRTTRPILISGIPRQGILCVAYTDGSNRYLNGLNWQLSSINFFVQKMALLVEELNIFLSCIWVF